MCEECIFVRHEIVWGEGNCSYCSLLGIKANKPKKECKHFDSK